MSKAKRITEGITPDCDIRPGYDEAKMQGMTVKDEPSNVIPEQYEVTPEYVQELERYIPKRGKDIKVFADLPPDVQETIHKLSTIDGKIDQRVKANRTAIAINYQHLFPDRYNSTGVE